MVRARQEFPGPPRFFFACCCLVSQVPELFLCCVRALSQPPISIQIRIYHELMNSIYIYDHRRAAHCVWSKAIRAQQVYLVAIDNIFCLSLLAPGGFARHLRQVWTSIRAHFRRRCVRGGFFRWLRARNLSGHRSYYYASADYPLITKHHRFIYRTN